MYCITLKKTYNKIINIYFKTHSIQLDKYERERERERERISTCVLIQGCTISVLYILIFMHLLQSNTYVYVLFTILYSEL